MGAGTTAQPLATSISGLAACTTYHFRATATSAGGTANGGDRTFTTLCPVPTVTTTAATGVTMTGATLNGEREPERSRDDRVVRVGADGGVRPDDGDRSRWASGSTAQPLSTAISGLAPCTTYHFRATGTSAGGTVFGGDLAFTTSCPAHRR